jgi:lipoprotein-anchoring transpeptidase ErfK/SrfK
LAGSEESLVPKPPVPKLEIKVSRTDRSLVFTETSGDTVTQLFKASIVSGCEDSGTPPGRYKAGKWIKDKTNPKHGPTPWSKDPWGNPYGPYFLPLNNPTTGAYTTYGIHGTRGPLTGNFEKPPVPEGLMRWFVGDDTAKYLYCSHGCVRLSNQNITKLFDLSTQPRYAGQPIFIGLE